MFRRMFGVLIALYLFQTAACQTDPCSLMTCPTFPNATARMISFHFGSVHIDECIFEDEGRNVTDNRLCGSEFQNLCDENNPIQLCDGWPCEGASCTAYPNAQCRNMICGDCVANFFMKNANDEFQRVNCAPP